jgi:putative ABC transport system ATP-binding protein
MERNIVSVANVTCQYQLGKLLSLPNIDIAVGQHTLLLGPSGSGKTTLLNVLAGLQTIKSGTVSFGDVNFSSLAAHQRDRLRGQKIGLVMQKLHLISALTVRANLALAMTLAGREINDQFINDTAGALNIADKLDRYPRQLSQGEAQRAAIARALVNRPQLVLADEPTSALDDVNAEAAILLLLSEASRHNATLIVATHDARIKAHFSHVVSLG